MKAVEVYYLFFLLHERTIVLYLGTTGRNDPEKKPNTDISVSFFLATVRATGRETPDFSNESADYKDRYSA